MTHCRQTTTRSRRRFRIRRADNDGWYGKGQRGNRTGRLFRRRSILSTSEPSRAVRQLGPHPFGFPSHRSSGGHAFSPAIRGPPTGAGWRVCLGRDRPSVGVRLAVNFRRNALSSAEIIGKAQAMVGRCKQELSTAAHSAQVALLIAREAGSHFQAMQHRRALVPFLFAQRHTDTQKSNRLRST